MAHWEINLDGYYPYCSECKTEPKNGFMSNFCPHCGADMRNPIKSELSEREIYQRAIDVYGGKHQEIIAIEECSELIQAITHKHRNRKDNITEEIADVEVMLEQLKIINDCTKEVKEMKEYKLQRLLQRLRGEIID